MLGEAPVIVLSLYAWPTSSFVRYAHMHIQSRTESTPCMKQGGLRDLRLSVWLSVYASSAPYVLLKRKLCRCEFSSRARNRATDRVDALQVRTLTGSNFKGLLQKVIGKGRIVGGRLFLQKTIYVHLSPKSKRHFLDHSSIWCKSS